MHDTIHIIQVVNNSLNSEKQHLDPLRRNSCNSYIANFAEISQDSQNRRQVIFYRQCLWLLCSVVDRGTSQDGRSFSAHKYSAYHFKYSRHSKNRRKKLSSVQIVEPDDMMTLTASCGFTLIECAAEEYINFKNDKSPLPFFH